LDRVEHSQNRATNTVTEMNFGLRSAGNGRLARHGRPGQGSTYLRTAIILNLYLLDHPSIQRLLASDCGAIAAVIVGVGDKTNSACCSVALIH
jgi:hypothetical protein